jgi:prolyl-tRNA synthetase
MTGAVAATAAAALRVARSGHVRPRSALLAPALRDAPAQAACRSHALLVRSGAARQASAAGLWHLLPLGLRALARLEALVDRELQRAPLFADKLRLPLLSAGELWQRSGRWGVYGDELFRLEDRRGAAFCLGPTFEEEITELVASLGPRPAGALPLRLYQVTTKYRDEARPRFGLVRGREFVMKDLYSFHADLACARETYALVCDAYARIFGALGLDFVKVLADSGAIGGSYTHEFQVLAEVGEDDIVLCDRGDFCANLEAAWPRGPPFALPPAPAPGLAKPPLELPAGLRCHHAGCSCGGAGELRAKRGLEIGQAFLLGQKYSQAFGAQVQPSSSNNKNKSVDKLFMEMGCYGIGMTRVLAAAIEAAGGADEDGIVWPSAIAPYDALVLTAPAPAALQDHLRARARELADQCAAAGLDVVLDDRWADSFGKKLAEAKLQGFPKILIVGKQALESGLVELLDRRSRQTALLEPALVLADLAKQRAAVAE